MAVFFLLLLVAFPIAEIAVLIAVGGEIGVLATLALLLLAGLGGIALIRIQGIATLFRVRAALGRGEAPTDALFQAACSVMAGVLFIIPGFLSDVMALALLSLLPLRNVVKRWLWQRAVGRRGGAPGPGPGRGPTIIEGEYETVDEGVRNERTPWGRNGGAPGETPPTLPPRD